MLQAATACEKEPLPTAPRYVFRNHAAVTVFPSITADKMVHARAIAFFSMQGAIRF